MLGPVGSNFEVDHPEKPEQIRVVFLSSSSVLLTCPDVSLFFPCRGEPQKPLDSRSCGWSTMISKVFTYWMKLPDFGNFSLIAIAIYRIRQAPKAYNTLRYAPVHWEIFLCWSWADVHTLWLRMYSIDLHQRTKASISESNHYLHDSADNSPEVMRVFLLEDYNKSLHFVLPADVARTQHSLRLLRKTASVIFNINVSGGNCWHGVLFKPHKSFWPLETFIQISLLILVAPVILLGRAVLHELTASVFHYQRRCL